MNINIIRDPAFANAKQYCYYIIQKTIDTETADFNVRLHWNEHCVLFFFSLYAAKLVIQNRCLYMKHANIYSIEPVYISFFLQPRLYSRSFSWIYFYIAQMLRGIDLFVFIFQ